MITVPIQKWPSDERLRSHLSSYSAVLMLKSREYPSTEFHSASILTNGGAHLEIGIGTYSEIRPEVALADDRTLALVGYNSTLATIECASSRVVTELRLFGVIYDFIQIGSPNELIVLHEIGVTRVSVLTGRLWEVSTDIVSGSAIDEEGRLVVSQMGNERKILIDIPTGTVL